MDFVNDPYIHTKIEALHMMLLESHGRHNLGSNFSMKATSSNQCNVKFTNGNGEELTFTGHPLYLGDLLFGTSEASIAWRLNNGVV